MMVKTSTFAKRLQEAMEIKDVTAADISRGTDISTAAISRYLRGAYVPKHEKMLALANFLGVNRQWLMGYDVSVVSKVAPPRTKNNDIDNAYIQLMSNTGDIGRAFRALAMTVYKQVSNSSPDTKLLEKFHALTKEHQTMVEAMINGFYLTDKENNPDEGEEVSDTQKGTPSLQQCLDVKK